MSLYLSGTGAGLRRLRRKFKFSAFSCSKTKENNVIIYKDSETDTSRTIFCQILTNVCQCLTEF